VREQQQFRLRGRRVEVVQGLEGGLPERGEVEQRIGHRALPETLDGARDVRLVCGLSSGADHHPRRRPQAKRVADEQGGEVRVHQKASAGGAGTKIASAAGGSCTSAGGTAGSR
jgi:hypothetical protein